MALDDKAIKEVNSHISDALKQWADIMLLADADNWAYNLEYSDKDVFNAVFIANHVLMNRAIKSGHINTEDKAVEMACEFRDSIRKYSGIDTIELCKNITKNGDKS
jgi:hypothetical protein